MKNTFLFILGILLVCVLEGWGQNPPCRISGEVEGVKKGDLFVLAIADDVSGAVKKTERIPVTLDGYFSCILPNKEECQAFLIHYPAECLPVKFSADFWGDNYKELFITSGELFVKGNLEHWGRAEVAGGIYEGTVKKYVHLKDSLDELSRQATREFSMLKKPSPEEQNQYSVNIMKLQNQKVKALLEFVHSSPDSKYAAYEYYSMLDFFSDRILKLVKDPFYQSPEMMSQVYNSFSADVKASKYGQLVRKFIGNKLAVAEGEKLPTFRYKDIRGEALCPSDFKGRYLLLEFWDSYCEPCMDCMPWMKRLNDSYADRGLLIIGISGDKQAEVCLETLRRLDCTWRQVCVGQWKKNKDILNKYAVGAFPTFILAGPDGKICIAGTTAYTLKEIEDYLVKHLR